MSLVLHPAHSIRAVDVIALVRGVIDQRGAPEAIRSDNGPEFIAKALRTWLEENQIDSLYIEPGAPWENGFAESFNSRFRDEFLGMEIFTSQLEARVLTNEWGAHYNRRRPHSSLGYLSPEGFAKKWRDEHNERQQTDATIFPPLRGRKGQAGALPRPAATAEILS